jgi:putative spermidine/putrescine transport system ATP-binding protein
MAFLSITNINKNFGGSIAVENFNLEVEKGEFISFLGPSGCGKTTTLRMVAGFETPTTGQILINGVDITYRPPNQRNVGMVFQSYALFPNMTVADNIGFGLKVAKKSKEEINKRVEEMLNLIHMPAFARRYPYQMSGGQQQRVALARALAIQPQVLLLDEPLSALDAKIRLELRTEIRAIQRKMGITTIYVTHDQEEALSLSDRVVVMNTGHIEQIGTPFEIYNFPDTPFVASFVGTLNLLNAIVKEPEQCLFMVDGQPVYGDKRIKYPAGAAVKIALRPEIISMNANDSQNNHLAATVDTVTFLGSIVRIQVKTGENHLFFDTFNNPNLVPPRVGDRLSLYFPRAAALVLNEKK